MEIDDKLKNRLAGTAVITVLTVIFLPMLFDDPVEKKGQVVTEMDIPHKPEVSPLLNTAIIPDKNSGALSKAELAATNPSLDNNETSDTAAGSESVSVDSPSVDSEEEHPSAEKKKQHKKVVETHVQTEEKLKSVKEKEFKKADVVVEQKKPVKPKAEKVPAKAELPVLDDSYKDKDNNAARAPLPSLDNRRWVVQVASLSDEAKAVRFRDKLRAQGFPANIDSVWIKGKGRVYRLKVGPDLDAQKAQAIKAKINQLHNVNSIAIAE